MGNVWILGGFPEGSPRTKIGGGAEERSREFVVGGGGGGAAGSSSREESFGGAIRAHAIAACWKFLEIF